MRESDGRPSDACIKTQARSDGKKLVHACVNSGDWTRRVAMVGGGRVVAEGTGIVSWVSARAPGGETAAKTVERLFEPGAIGREA